MAECIEREATIKRIKEVYCVDCNSYNGVRCRACGTGDAIDMIEDAPVIDAEVVVRCKDCKHLVAVNVNGKGIPTCRVSGMEVAPDEFCSRGEKGRRRQH